MHRLTGFGRCLRAVYPRAQDAEAIGQLLKKKIQWVVDFFEKMAYTGMEAAKSDRLRHAGSDPAAEDCMEKQKAKKKKWLRFRHRVIRNLAYLVFMPYVRLRYGIRVEPFRDQGDRQYLIVLNHQALFDQFFVGMSFRGPIYYLATEDIFSNGWISRLLSWAIAPIPIKKQTTDMKAVMNCMRVVKEGGTIAIAPEGNRTYCGRTGYIKPSIAKLVKALKLPLAIYRIEGGYGFHPRWSNAMRKGPVRCYVSEVIEPEECRAMSDEQLCERIVQGLWVDEAELPGVYRHKKQAEYLERAVYVCPTCGFSRFESRDDIISCKGCGIRVRHREDKRLEGVDCSFPFDTVGSWYEYQCGFVNRIDPAQHLTVPIYRDTADLSEVILYKHKKPLRKNAELCLYGDRITIDEMTIPFEQASVITVLGRNKLNVYHGGKVYQLKGDNRFNALKYVNLFHRYKNVSEGNEHGEFLGL